MCVTAGGRRRRSVPRYSDPAGPGVRGMYCIDDTETPPTKLTGRVKLWEESARSVLAHSPQGKHVAVSGAGNIIQVQQEFMR